MAEEIVNRVAKSPLVQVDLEEYLPKEEVVTYDLSQNLYEGLVLRENDFRDFVKSHDWDQYQNKIVAVYCSADAIVPNWVYMILSSKITEKGGRCFFGEKNSCIEKALIENFEHSDFMSLEKKKVLVKGCGSFELSPATYVEITRLLNPIVQSLMFGEACSSVPVYKRPAS